MCRELTNRNEHRVLREHHALGLSQLANYPLPLASIQQEIYQTATLSELPYALVVLLVDGFVFDIMNQLI